MPTSSLNDVFRVAARLNVPVTGDFVNVFHYKLTGGVDLDDEDVADDLTAIIDMLYSKFYGMISSDAAFVDINIFNVTQDRPLGSYAWPTMVNGARTGDMLPPQVAAFVRGITGYSRNWARKFFGPIGETDNLNEGYIAPASMPLLVTAAAEWVVSTAIVLNTWYPVVYHARTGQWRELVSALVTNVWATIRRRRAGRGA